MLVKYSWERYIFLGYYKERRYVDELGDYRDLVVISKAETELISNLIKARKDFARNERYNTYWIGITGPEVQHNSSEYCLLTRLKHVPFGHFWFQILSLNDDNGHEISVNLKVIRELKLEDYKSALSETSTKSDEKNSDVPEEYSFDFDPVEIGRLSYLYLKESVRQIQSHLTLQDFMKVTRFCSVTIIVLLVESLTCISKLGEFTLKAMEILVKLIEVLSPVIIVFLECLCKIVGGFYILVTLCIKSILMKDERNLSIRGPEISRQGRYIPQISNVHWNN